MKFLNKRHIAATVTGLCMVSHCAVALQEPDAAGLLVIPVGANDSVELGETYNRYTEEFLSAIPVQAWVVKHGNVATITNITSNASQQELAQILSGEASLSQSSWFVDVEASASYLSEMTGNAQSVVFSLYRVKTTGTKSLVFNTNGADVISAVGAEGAQMAPGERLARLGTGYVTQINYGATLLANLEFNFTSASQKEEFDGQMSLSGSGANFSVDAQKASNGTFSDVSVTVKAIQSGGDPVQLVNILDANVINCSWQSRQSCIDSLNSIYDYAVGDFEDQIDPDDLSTSTVLRYTIKEYADDSNTQIQALAVADTEVLPTNSYFNNIETLTTLHKAEKNNKATLAQMLSYSLDRLTTVEQLLLDKMYQAANTNTARLAHYIKSCRNNFRPANDPDSCAQLAAQCLTGNSCLINYDMSKVTSSPTQLETKLAEYYRTAKTGNWDMLGQELFPGNSGFNMFDIPYVLPYTPTLNQSSKYVSFRHMLNNATGTFSN